MINLIPQPKSVIYTKDKGFKPGKEPEITVFFKSSDERIIKLINKVFNNPVINVQSGEHEGFIMGINLKKDFNPDNNEVGKIKDTKEGYYLRIDKDLIVVCASCAAGLFYGIQTLKQILTNYKEIPALKIMDWPDTEMRVMNYDLRQTFPKFELLIKYIEEFACYKANTLLIEYEDKLPFEKHYYLRNKDFCFTMEQFKLLKETARENFIEIIPLQQSFGHLEYVLKHDRHKHLRETYEALGELCPSKPESYELSRSLLDEVINKHPEARYIHLGCDEVWSLCKCEKCDSINNGSRENTFITFVNKLIDYVSSQGKIPIIWHDMMGKCSDEELKLLDKRVVVMIWIYGGEKIYDSISEMVAKFKRNGIEVMGAPSIRCNDRKVEQNYPLVKNRIGNLEQWLKACEEYKINCMVSTNWATSFVLGCPYGIFETTWYLIAFSSEIFWNRNSERNSFLKRFFAVFHGGDEDEINRLSEYHVMDYYSIIGNTDININKNKDVAELIRLMKQYESVVATLIPVKNYLYRLSMFKDEEVDRMFITIRQKKNMKALMDMKVKMKEILAVFLPDTMVNMYVQSRFFVEEFLDKNLF